MSLDQLFGLLADIGYAAAQHGMWQCNWPRTPVRWQRAFGRQGALLHQADRPDHAQRWASLSGARKATTDAFALNVGAGTQNRTGDTGSSRPVLYHVSRGLPAYALAAARRC